MFHFHHWIHWRRCDIFEGCFLMRYTFIPNDCVTFLCFLMRYTFIPNDCVAFLAFWCDEHSSQMIALLFFAFFYLSSILNRRQLNNDVSCYFRIFDFVFAVFDTLILLFRSSDRIPFHSFFIKWRQFRILFASIFCSGSFDVSELKANCCVDGIHRIILVKWCFFPTNTITINFGCFFFHLLYDFLSAFWFFWSKGFIVFVPQSICTSRDIFLFGTSIK